MSKRRYVYFQPNKKDLKDKVGDCQIRAFSKVLDLSWLEAFDLTIPICRNLQTYTIFDCDLAKTKDAMRQLGFEYTGISIGKIVCKCKLVDCVRMDDDFIETVKKNRNEYVSGFYSSGRYAWILEDVVPVESEKVKGRLGLWECDEREVIR